MKKILIVEDDEAIRTELITLLRSNGYMPVELTKNEARILWCLMQKELCSRDELIEDLWTNGMYIDGNTLYVNIGRLREKLERIGAKDFIRTGWKVKKFCQTQKMWYFMK